MTPRWRGDTVCIIASGPSLTAADVRYARDHARRCVVINDTWRKLPSADVLYAADAKWWCDPHKPPKPVEFAGERWSSQKQWERDPAKLGVQIVQTQGGEGLADKPPIFEGLNSTYQATGLVALWGVSRIVYLGLDMKHGPNGETHHHGDHPVPFSNPSPRFFHFAMFAYGKIAPPLAKRGITVINASRDTALTCFPRMTIEEALA